MQAARAEIEWAPRLSKTQLRQFYRTLARGIWDEALIDEVGYALYSRCESILTVHAAKRGNVKCPRCLRQGQETIIVRRGGLNELLQCPVCAWQLTWHDYYKSFRRKQLNSGGAKPIFRRYLQEFRNARSPREKVIAIDRLIHEFHYYLRGTTLAPTRSTAPNLIDGKLTDLIGFLDGLSAGAGIPELQATYAVWRNKLDRTNETTEDQPE